MTKPAHQFSITLPDDMAAIVESKLRTGAYASASEVMHDGLEASLDREAALERWLRDEVMAGHAEYLRDPATGVPATDVLKRIKRRRAHRDPT